jgi:hypothetical protein
LFINKILPIQKKKIYIYIYINENVIYMHARYKNIYIVKQIVRLLIKFIKNKTL